MQLLCRNRVTDFDRWMTIFSGHKKAHRAAGLALRGLWRSSTSPDDVFFLFEVEDKAQADAFMSDPNAAEAADGSGVIDGDYHYLDEVPGY